MRHRVVIVQETVPTYRRPFFARLRDDLADSGTNLIVVTSRLGDADVSDAQRDDSWIVRVPVWTPRRASASASRLRLHGVLHGADLVVAEQALRHIETYELLARQAMGRLPVALWGHGRTLVKPVSALSRWALQRVSNRAHWFFAYTEGARVAAVHGGFPPERVTVVQNAIDTEEVVAARHAIKDEEVDALRRNLRLPERGVCVFVGTLRTAKRLEFLLAASELVAAQIPHFKLIVAGDGPDRHLIERALGSYSWLRYAGSADAQQKALLASVSEVMLAPGRVGLVAVDSFALRTPIVTTRWPLHGPEFEYLVDGRNAIVTADDVHEYARGVEHLLGDAELLEGLKHACDADAHRYTLEAMVRNFSEGVLAALAAPRRGHVS